MEKGNRQYYDLDVWKESRKLVSDIYELTKSFPSEEKFSLTSQLRLVKILFRVILTISKGKPMTVDH